MKVGYLTDNVHPTNGWGRYSLSIIHGVQAAGHDVVVLTKDDGGGVPVLRSGLGMFFSVLRVQKILKDCDVVHAIDINPFGIIASMAQRLQYHPLILTYVGSYSTAALSHPTTRWLSTKAVHSAQRTTAISRFVKGIVEKLAGATNIEVITPGIDFNAFHQEHTFGPQKFILSVGELKYRKGYHVAIPAFAEIHKKIPDVRYVIVGSQRDVGYVQHLKSLVHKYQLESFVDFVSDVSDQELRRLYGTASLFVLTSVNQGLHIEGFGMVFLEAAASGLPVVGTLGNGVEDAVANARNGMLVSQGDIPATSEAIFSLLNDPKKWSEFSNASYEWASVHDNRFAVAHYLKIYDSLLP